MFFCWWQKTDTSRQKSEASVFCFSLRALTCLLHCSNFTLSISSNLNTHQMPTNTAPSRKFCVISQVSNLFLLPGLSLIQGHYLLSILAHHVYYIPHIHHSWTGYLAHRQIHELFSLRQVEWWMAH